MRVSSIRLRNVASHVDTQVELPERGIVLVTGPNGAGKSAIIDAVALTVWGQTSRGRPLWSGPDGQAEVVLDGIRYSRTRKRGVITELSRGGERGDTAKKSQSIIDAHVCAYSVWAAACAFSSDSRASFARATDGGRKRMLEDLVGLVAFDPARARVSALRKLVERECAGHRSALVAARASAEVWEAVIDAAPLAAPTQALAGPTDPGPTRGELEALEQALADARATVVALAGERGGAVGRARSADRAVAEAAASVCAGVCSLCGRANVDDDEHSTVERDARIEQDAAQDDLADVLRRLAQANDAVGHASRELTDAHERSHAAEHEARVAERIAADRARRDSALAELAGIDEEITRLAELLADADRRLAEYSTAEQALGLSGIRGRMIDVLLVHLQAAGSRWLGMMSSTLTMELTLGVERPDIVLTIGGAGGGYGFDALSGGEKRRVDVALTLAIAEVATAVAGWPGSSTIFFDEVFDALDRDGVERACEALQLLAETRCVVVISHNDDLVELLRPTQRIRVDSGRC